MIHAEGRNARQCAFACILRAALAACLFPFLGGEAAAQSAPSPAAQTIETGDTAQSDEAIAERLAAIYGEIDRLSQIETAAGGGVVRLGGSVANETIAAEAVAIARRVEGVVAVEDQITRTLEVEDNLAPVLSRFSDLIETARRAWPLYLLALASFFGVALLGFGLASWRGLWAKLAPNPFIATIIGQFVRFSAIVVGALVALTLLDAMALFGAIAGGAGLFGLAIGFAVRDTIENYLASVMLSLRQPFRANDYVKINDLEGVVIRLTSRATILMTLEGNHLRIPNATVFKGVILNYTRNPDRRFDFALGVDAEDDPLEAIALGIETLADQAFILDEPAARGFIEEVGDSNIILRFFGWIDQRETDFLKSRSAAIAVVKNALEGAGFTLPEPIYRVRLGGASMTVSEDQASPDAADRRSEPADPDESLKIDTSADRDIEEQVAAERMAGDEEDLLTYAGRLE